MINSKIHSVIDYLVVIFLVAAPSIFALPEITAKFTYALAIVHFMLTILTKFEYGIFKVIPIVLHGWIELLVSLALVGVAFYLGTLEIETAGEAAGDLARNFYLCFAAAVFVTYLLTDYKGKNKLA